MTEESDTFPTRYLILACCVLVGVLITRLWRLNTPGELYWDEVYFGFTAQQYLDGNRDAYNPWATPPKDRAYEWTHPPLGKLIIAGTMSATSRDVRGMRLAGVLFGTASVALVMLIGFLLTRSPTAALLAGVLYAMDGLNFVMSRIATIDVFETTFILAALAFYIAWRRRDGTSNWLLLGAGLWAGAALSTKWVGLFLIALMGADLLVMLLCRGRLAREHDAAKQRVPARSSGRKNVAPATRGQDAPDTRSSLRTILIAGTCLTLVPAAVYMASYLHYFLMGWGWDDFVKLQQQMWYYHTGLKETPQYSSVPWQWVLNVRPVWLYVNANSASDTTIANIYNLGNSVVLYFGLAAMLVIAVRFVRRRQWEAGFLLAAYLIFWLPWVRSPRAMYFYHYMPSTAMLCIAAGWVLCNWQTARHWALRAMVLAIPLLAMVWFIIFYPNMTAIEVPRWWADAVYGFIHTWR